MYLFVEVSNCGKNDVELLKMFVHQNNELNTLAANNEATVNVVQIMCKLNNLIHAWLCTIYELCMACTHYVYVPVLYCCTYLVQLMYTSCIIMQCVCV